ncbi:MAG: T9SS type A sorting domain-containing protein, partial [Deferribacteres bacterium]|nr:T9SS type A sorting domain-containing protein [Deferribacteres bacterium]
NVLLSNLSDNRISEHWISGDSLAIEIAFGWFNEHSATQYSNLPSLLANGVKFIQENGNWGEILLFTNSDQFGTSAEANQLIEDVVFLMNPRIPIHVIEYQTTNLSYTRIGSRYYYGNEYFNINLARITGGNYVKNFTTNAWQREPLTSILPEAFQLLSTSMHSFDLHTSMGNGFTFSRQNVGTVNDIIFLNDPIIQVGQYSGSFPMNIEISGTINSEVLRQSISVPESDFYASDEFVRTMWAGNYIQSLEQLPETNDIINEIIEYSVNERVISKFTAFLCLEPSRGGEVCYDCMDESSLLPVQEIADMEVDSLRIQVFPNPSSSVARIKIQSLSPLKKAHFLCKIHDIRGREIKAFTDIPAATNKTFELVWDLTNDAGTAVSNGVYFVQVVVNGRKYTAKLTVLR